jgi:hypothetical protein
MLWNKNCRYGHKFEPVYDNIPPVSVKADLVPPWHLANLVLAFSKKLYVGHVCKRCGDKIMR